MLIRFFNVLAWPPLTLLCPLCASIRAMESSEGSDYEACLAYWILCSVAAILEIMLAKLLAWLPFWPYAKGIAIILLVVPYFGGASYVYFHFVSPYVSGNLQICRLLLIPNTKPRVLNEQSNTLEAVERSCAGEEEEDDESEKLVIYEGKCESKRNDDTKETDPKCLGRGSRKEVQKEWSCALCLVSTTSKTCLEKHFQGKKHKAKEDERTRNHLVRLAVAAANETSSSLGNLNLKALNRNKWANLKKLTILLNPIARSISWCTWKKPDFGWTKLNADGSVDRDSASFGGLLRDYGGKPICAYVSKASSSIDDIFLVELWAIWRGLVLAQGLGVKVIWVESDSMSVVKTINKQQPYCSRAGACLKHIWKLLKGFDNYKVSHSWRESNKAADHLSKMEIVGSDVVLWPEDFPHRLRNIIHDDARGRWYRRG